MPAFGVKPTSILLGAMDTIYQRGKIQEESMYYGHKKRRVVAAGGRQHVPAEGAYGRHRHRDRTDPLDRGGEGQQIENVAGYERNRNGYASDELKPLQATARERRNVFASLMEAVKTHSLGQISHALHGRVGSIGGICSSNILPTDQLDRAVILMRRFRFATEFN